MNASYKLRYKRGKKMSSQWIWRIIYIIFIAAVTYLVATFSEASKVVDFLVDRKEELMADDRAMIAATVIANNHNKTDVYVLASPLYEETFESITHHVKVSIYPLVEFKNNSGYNSIAILLSHIDIKDDQAIKNDQDEHLIDIQLEFHLNSGTVLGNTNIFKEPMTTLFDNTGRMIVIHYDLLKKPTEVAQLKSIVISYAVSNSIDETFVNLSNSDLIEVTANDIFAGNFNRDIQNASPKNLDILSIYGLEDFQTHSDIYYNDMFISELDSYNYYYLRNIAIELVIVLPITYFLFFHKHLKRRKREKDRLKTITNEDN